MILKFRAWNNIKRKFVEIESILKNEETGVFDSIISTSGFLPERDIEIMQFTGLLDRNGKEIYEGDILKFDDTAIGGPKDIGEVVWFDDLTCINAPGFYLWNSKGYFPSFPFDREIIGNIHDHPELLKEQS